jgi:hypothetical protein
VLLEDLFDRGVGQVLLALEVVVEGSEPDIGHVGDLLDADLPGSRDTSSLRAAATSVARFRAFRQSSRLALTSEMDTPAPARASSRARRLVRSAVSSGITRVSPSLLASLQGLIKSD